MRFRILEISLEKIKWTDGIILLFHLGKVRKGPLMLSPAVTATCSAKTLAEAFEKNIK